MLKIHIQEKIIESRFESIIKERMSELTCKTNVSPQLMFKQSYTGIANKLFVGNWTKDGFWISKFRLQVFEFRPDIIIRFVFLPELSFTKLRIRYSIGISSILQFLLLQFLVVLAFGRFGEIMLPISLIVFPVGYIFVGYSELKRAQRTVNDRITNDLSNQIG